MKKLLALITVSFFVLIMIAATAHSGGPKDFFSDSYVKARLLFTHGAGATQYTSWPNADGTEAKPPWAVAEKSMESAVSKTMRQIRRMR